MKEKDFEIRVPSSLLRASLPAWVKLVWIAIRGFQGSGKYCFASFKTIGEQILNDKGKSMDKSQVSRAVKELETMGFLLVNGRKNLVCISPEKVDQESTYEDEKQIEKLIRSQPKLIRSQRKVDQESTRTENQHLKPTRKANKEIEVSAKTKTKFVKPELSEIKEYFEDRRKAKNLNFDPSLQAEKFLNHYESNGWRVGRNPMKDWKASIRNWITNIRDYGKPRNQTSHYANDSDSSAPGGDESDKWAGLVARDDDQGYIQRPGVAGSDETGRDNSPVPGSASIHQLRKAV